MIVPRHVAQGCAVTACEQHRCVARVSSSDNTCVGKSIHCEVVRERKPELSSPLY